MVHNLAQTAASRGHGGNGGDVIGFQGMLQPQQKAKAENGEHELIQDTENVAQSSFNDHRALWRVRTRTRNLDGGAIVNCR